MLFEERCADMFSLSRPIRVIASAPPGSVSRHDGHTAVVPPHLEEVHRMHVDAAGWRSRNSRESLIARLNLLVGQLKEASGIAEKAGLVLLTLADQNSVAFEVSQWTLSPDQRERLAENLVRIKYARTFPTFEIQITRHTDDTWGGKADHSASSRS